MGACASPVSTTSTGYCVGRGRLIKAYVKHRVGSTTSPSKDRSRHRYRVTVWTQHARISLDRSADEDAPALVGQRPAPCPFGL